MKTLYLIRHAQSAANAGGISLPDREIPLSAEGARQAAELACRLPENRRVFVSEMRRTHETAAPYCARHGIRPEILPCLNEFSYLPLAAVQGLDAAARKPLAEAYWQRADPHFRAGSGADTFAEFNGRISDFLHRAWPILPHGSLLFGHGIWMALLAWRHSAPFKAACTLPMSPCGGWTAWNRRRNPCSACLKTLRNFDAARKAACTFRAFKVQAAFGSGSG